MHELARNRWRKEFGLNIGFITNSLVQVGVSDLRSIADWAYRNRFDTIGIGPTLELDCAELDAISQDNKVQISDLMYCRNFLLENEAEYHMRELLKRIDIASRYCIPRVVTTTGIDRGIDMGETFDFHDAIRKRPIRSLDAVTRVLETFLNYAEHKNVDIALELCPAMGNIAISPYLLQLLFERLPSKRLGIVFDPSHLVWQMIDPYDFIFEFADRIMLVHGKDTEILYNELKRKGILSDFSWWRYRIPGLGEINWKKIISNLQEAGYKGTISIEHEDPVWEGSEEKVKAGLLIGQKTLLSSMFLK